MIHIVGFAGTALVLGAYFLISAGRLRPQSYGYQGMNLIGAALLTIYAIVLAAWAVLALNVVWGVIAIAALARVVGRSQRESA